MFRVLSLSVLGPPFGFYCSNPLPPHHEARMGYFTEKLLKRFSRDRAQREKRRPAPSLPVTDNDGSGEGGCFQVGRESFIRRKLSIFRRTKASVAPSSSLGIVVPGPSSSSRGSPDIARAAVLDQRAPTFPVSHSNSPRPSFGFLSRRFFSGSRNRTTLSTPTVPPTPPPLPAVLSSHNNHTEASIYPRRQRQYQLNGGGGGGGQRDSGNGQQSSTVYCSPSAAVTSVFSPPKAVSTNTGTISKLSSAASANCTWGFKSSITLRVICIRGGSIDVTFPITKTGRELKMEAIGRFSVDWGNSTSPASAQSTLAKYKLVTMDRRNVIDEELTLDRNGLRDRGEWNQGFAGVNVGTQAVDKVERRISVRLFYCYHTVLLDE